MLDSCLLTMFSYGLSTVHAFHGTESLSSFSYKSANHHKGPTPMTSSEPNYSPKPHLLKPSQGELGLRHMNLAGGGEWVHHKHSAHYPIPLASEWFRHGPFLFLKMTERQGLSPFSTWGIWCWGHPLAASLRTGPAQRGQSQEHHRTGS